MAVFEQKVSSKVTLDDTIRLKCVVENAYLVKDHTEYLLRIHRGWLPENSWTLTKRYADFVSLDTSLKPSGIDLPLPPKKMFGNLDREFVAERQKGLQHYMDEVLNKQILLNNVFVKKFLDPTNYSNTTHETTFQQISMFLRSETLWDVQEPAPDIGWRIRKCFFLLRNKHDPKTAKFILSWCKFGPDKFFGSKDLQSLMKLLPTIQHPNIHKVELAVANENNGVCVRPFCEQGSLRDIICKSKPQTCYLKKYGSPKALCCGSMESIKLYGTQILTTLKYLYDKGLPYGHLHAGNVLVENSQCKLLELENWLLGVPSLYRSYYTQFKKIRTVEETDVYNFGHLLYEMAMGEALNAPTCDKYVASCPAEIRSVLESILSTEACKNGLPSIGDLLMHPLFADVVLPPSEKCVLKIPSKLKEVLREAKLSFERRLQDEQKLIYQCQRRSKAEAFHMSEEEKKKRRRSNMKRLSSQQNGEEPSEAPTNGAPTNQNTTTPSAATRAQTEVLAADTSNSDPPTPTPAPPVTPPSVPIAEQDTSDHVGVERRALLDSISQFNKSALRRSATNDSIRAA